MECMTLPSNTSGPFPGGNSGMFGTPLKRPMHSITKSTSYTLVECSIISSTEIFHFPFPLDELPSPQGAHVSPTSSSSSASKLMFRTLELNLMYCTKSNLSA
uniref:Uncharacterized protein n=1 Tax=Opuntia streptacantha TaxID=393608 RepID=A0A7C9E9K9_OPUST